MNKAHLEYCSSDEWAAALRRWIIPGALDGVELRAPVLEIGPGPGRTTEVLRTMAPGLVAIEIDGPLAASLSDRLSGDGVRVLRGDATALPFHAGAFRTVLSFTMLHHVPSAEEQDRLLAEAGRVLAPGGMFVGVDSLDSPEFRALHVDDICVPVDPATVEARLRRAGFSSVRAEPNPYVLQFHAAR
jgi:SAM-dependent methyltransferase